jgi:hypothetical protein
MARRISITDTFHWGNGESAAKDSSRISQNRGVHQGKMVGFKLTINDNTGNRTATLKVKDSDGDVIYTSGACAENATTVTMGLDIPLIEKEIITITPSGDPGASGMDVTNIALYYHPDPVIP